MAIGGHNEIFRELYPIPVVPPELQALREKRTEKRTNVYQKARSSEAQNFSICIGWNMTGCLLNPHMFTDGKVLDYPPMSPQPESITKSMLGDRWIIAKYARPASSYHIQPSNPSGGVQIVAAIELFIDNKGGVWRQGAPPPPNVGESMPMAFRSSVTGILNNIIQALATSNMRMHCNTCKDPVCAMCHPYEYVTSKLSELQKYIKPIHDWIAIWKDCDDFQKEYDEIYKTKFADYDKELQTYNERIKERTNNNAISLIER